MFYFQRAELEREEDQPPSDHVLDTLAVRLLFLSAAAAWRGGLNDRCLVGAPIDVPVDGDWRRVTLKIKILLGVRRKYHREGRTDILTQYMIPTNRPPPTKLPIKAGIMECQM